MMQRVNLPSVLFAIGVLFVFLAPALVEEHPAASAVCALIAAVFVFLGNKENGGRDE